MDLAYVAGLFDGEGYVRVSKWEKPNSTHIRYNITAGINMTYRPIIEQLHTTFGGGFHMNRYDLRNPKQRIGYCWVVASQYAANFLRQIQPHAIVKRAQIDLAIEFQQNIDDHAYTPRGRPGPNGQQFRDNREALLAYREECFVRMREMKKETFDPLPPRPRGRPGGRSHFSVLRDRPIETDD